jgi:uncharacterized protein
MTVSLYDVAAPLLRGQLTALAAVLDKGAAFAEAKKVEPAVLLNARLAPDMFALTRQVQIATDIARGGMARLAGVEPPKEEDNEASFADLRARVQRTVDYIDGISPAALDGAEKREITLKQRAGDITMSGIKYLTWFVIPNVGFHCTTTYNILRHNGAEIGKRDFLGPKD